MTRGNYVNWAQHHLDEDSKRGLPHGWNELWLTMTDPAMKAKTREEAGLLFLTRMRLHERKALELLVAAILDDSVLQCIKTGAIEKLRKYIIDVSIGSEAPAPKDEGGEWHIADEIGYARRCAQAARNIKRILDATDEIKKLGIDDQLISRLNETVEACYRLGLLKKREIKVETTPSKPVRHIIDMFPPVKPLRKIRA